MTPLRRLVPSPLRRWLKRLPISPLLEEGVDQLEVRWAGSPADISRLSRERWRRATPDASLTWGLPVSGEAFVRRVDWWRGFGPDKRILELGPGYGRLLQASLELRLPFHSYLGVDISPENVAFLKRRFEGDSQVGFLCADFEQVELPGSFDTLLSSLTFKHLYPSFAPTLAHVAPHLAAGSLLFFDLIEGHRRHFDRPSGTYVRCYKREEVRQILESLGYRLLGLETLAHAPGFSRLLVSAAWPAAPSQARGRARSGQARREEVHGETHV